MLHVLTGAHCNNHCLFCMESDREGRRRHVLSQSSADIQRFIEQYPGRDEILFTSGEPTTSRDLDRYVTWAREAGYETIGLITNGRRLSRPKYAAALIARGVNKITVSIHGHDAATHDGLTQARGSFEQTRHGLERLAALRRGGRRFDLHTCTVVVRPNIPYLAELYQLLRQLDVDRMCFNVMMVKGFGAERITALMPRYSDVAQAFGALAAGLGARDLTRIALADVPRCATVGLPQRILGAEERFDQYEAHGSVGIAEADLARMGEDERRGALAQLRPRARSTDLEADHDYYMAHRETKDGFLRTKRPACHDCVFDPTCPGVWRGYADAFGWDELQPVAEGRSEDRSPGRV